MNNSEAVKKWRKSTKKRIVESFGGECCVCGYSKCYSSLALHHLDPEEKDFNFGKVRANPISWKRICNELRKCVLVCNNCHGEIHDGITDIPKDAHRFNEDFVDYKEMLEKYDKPSNCPFCGERKPSWQKACNSRACMARIGRVVWEDFDYLIIEKKLSNIKIAEIVGCSSTAVWKRRKKLGV